MQDLNDTIECVSTKATKKTSSFSKSNQKLRNKSVIDLSDKSMGDLSVKKLNNITSTETFS